MTSELEIKIYKEQCDPREEDRRAFLLSNVIKQMGLPFQTEVLKYFRYLVMLETYRRKFLCPSVPLSLAHTHTYFALHTYRS